jgi:hypothetical protein
MKEALFVCDHASVCTTKCGHRTPGTEKLPQGVNGERTWCGFVLHRVKSVLAPEDKS